ncbi:MAG TPA: hypothetical protein VH143_01310, partial [Kofleriaceae bacterium]|nr:hypothetical protein [Kofleriaceae bacterium]
MKPIFLGLVGVLAISTVASAEDEVPTTTAPVPVAPVAPTASGGPFQKGAMGISTGLEGGFGPNYIIDFAYFLSDKAALDILGGIQFSKTPNTAVAPAPDNSASEFGFALGLGYRLYTHKGQTIHTYLQPFGLIQSTDVSNIGDNFALDIGVNFGAEAFVNDWLSFRGQ